MILYTFLATFASAAVIEDKRVLAPTVDLSYAKVVGAGGLVESFRGIPYAQPPTGNLRLRAPQPITGNLGTVNAAGLATQCPQGIGGGPNTTALPAEVTTLLDSIPGLTNIASALVGEDCLTVSVQRPLGTTSSSKLPVLFWIYGGGFSAGSTAMYDATQLILNAQTHKMPFIFVEVNYRLGAFGFLPGSEVLAENVANLGLLDQRLGLQWTADNIAAFGGDPSKVTIWGESAGSISVFDQMALYGGDNTYNGKALFRSAIMNSGSIVPADPVDCPKGREVYAQVVKAAGCSGQADTLACLRSLDYQTFSNAANSLPGIFSYNSLALTYLPRPDGTALPLSPEIAAQQGKYAAVPMMIGDQEDEGTLFSLVQSNITTTAQLVNYLSTVYFRDATTAQIQTLVNLYPDSAAAGSPFNTGIFNNIYPQFKRIAAILGDLTFTLTRRVFLQIATDVNPSVKSWSYLNSYLYGTPILGTFHGADILSSFGYLPGFPQITLQNYYYNFLYNSDPNVGITVPNWPTWSSSKQLINIKALTTSLIPDNFRQAAYNYIAGSASTFHI